MPNFFGPLSTLYLVCFIVRDGVHCKDLVFGCRVDEMVSIGRQAHSTMPGTKPSISPSTIDLNISGKLAQISRFSIEMSKVIIFLLILPKNSILGTFYFLTP